MPVSSILPSDTCTASMCGDAKALMDQMWEVYNNLVATYSNFDANTFLPAATSIQKSYDDNYHWYDWWIGFNPACCTMYAIGEQARSLTSKMLASVGAADIPAPPSGNNTDWFSVLVVGGAIVLLVVYSPQLKKAFA